MIPAQIIAAKRDGEELSLEQIAFFIHGYSTDQIPDYQMSALTMAIFLNGMTVQETACLTQEMLNSGTRLSWPDDGRIRADKHSTGGVGDKISIPLAPILACCGLQIPMLSGRGLGATGGTLDKLESIPGFRTDLSLQEIQQMTQDVGCVITGASAELAPADRRLYALRDVTGTVPSIPLITASIMSKKLAESPDVLVLDVKFGSGAFMKTQDAAEALARSLVQTGHRMGVTTTAMLTDMNQPLGRMCGNAVEIIESLDVLRGEGPADVVSLTMELAAELLVSSGSTKTREEGRVLAAQAISSGSAMQKFHEMVRAQGGALDEEIRVAPSHEVLATTSGVVRRIDTEQLGRIIIEMGGGRRQLSDTVDHGVGLEQLVSVGDTVREGQPVARVFCDTPASHITSVCQSIHIGVSAEPLPLIVKRITADQAC